MYTLFSLIVEVIVLLQKNLTEYDLNGYLKLRSVRQTQRNILAVVKMNDAEHRISRNLVMIGE
jgi:hypothetical protein